MMIRKEVYKILRYIKPITGIINSLILLFLGFSTIQALLSFFPWSPFGYYPEGGGAQLIILLISIPILFLIGIVNLWIFKSLNVIHTLRYYPFYLVMINLLIIAFSFYFNGSNPTGLEYLDIMVSILLAFTYCILAITSAYKVLILSRKKN